MKTRHMTAIAIALALGLLSAQEPNAPAEGVRFLAIDVFIDSDTQPLAAYQLHISASHGGVNIVGIEGGEHAAFRTPPYYDPKAMQQERVILGAFNTSAPEQLPRGKTRVATIHVQATGSKLPNFTTKIEAAATSDGRPIAVDVSLLERNTK